MQCEKCGTREATQVKWRWNLCNESACIIQALTGSAKVIPCSFCSDRSTGIFWDKEICASNVCRDKARAGRIPEFQNGAQTTFGKNNSKRASSGSYTSVQERKWADIAEATGFNQDGTKKV